MSRRMRKYLIPRRSQAMTIQVDPFCIIYAKRRDDWPGYVKKWPSLCCPGTWDIYQEAYQPFREQQLRELLRSGTDYRQTSWYADLMDRLARYGKTRFPRCNGVEDVHRYFQGIYELHDSMQAHGYQKSGMHGGEGEIGVRVSRRGELLKCGQGTHRLAMARILGIPAVFVSIDLVHSGWMNHCLRQFEAQPLASFRAWLKTLEANSVASYQHDS
jgi:hypothetical protein